jgi:hypothetical protein
MRAALPVSLNCFVDGRLRAVAARIASLFAMRLLRLK